MADLAEVLRLGGAAFLRTHALSAAQAGAWRAICACRTPVLGGQHLACAACGHHHWHYHSCRNRHCPRCGARAKDAWLRGRLAEVLDVPYVHLVFTLPHELCSLYRVAPRWVIETLFASVAATLKDFAAQARWMGVADGQPAFSLVLHTWSQELRQHLHLHAVMACGVLGSDGQWHVPVRSPDFLFPVHALGRVFRGRFMQALRQLAQAGAPAAPAPATHDANLSPAGRKALYRHDWVVYAKAPLGGPAQVLSYLSRYSHRTAIGNERIRAVSAEQVVFSARADEHGAQRRVRLDTGEFIRRFLLHVLPGGIKRIRHYGVLANGCKKTQLAQARSALQQPAPNPLARESAAQFMVRVSNAQIHTCPKCRGPMQLIQTLPGLRRLPAPGSSVAAAARAPPQARAPPRAPP